MFNSRILFLVFPLIFLLLPGCFASSMREAEMDNHNIHTNSTTSTRSEKINTCGQSDIDVTLNSDTAIQNNSSVSSTQQPKIDSHDERKETRAREQSYSQTQKANHSNSATKNYASDVSVNLNELFGRGNSSFLQSVAVQIATQEGNYKFLEMLNRGYSNDQLATAIMQYMIKKWESGDADSVQRMFGYMTEGAMQQGDLSHASLISKASEVLFGVPTYSPPPAIESVDLNPISVITKILQESAYTPSKK